MKIAAVQMVSGTDVRRNSDAAQRLIGEAARAGAELVALPEYFCLMGRSDRDKLAIAEAPGDGPLQRMLSDTAREHRIWLIGGTLPIRTDDPDRVLNANCVYAPDGTLARRYDKIHLFK
jgi:nitrilase